MSAYKRSQMGTTAVNQQSAGILREIYDERLRQIHVKGYSTAQDDRKPSGTLTLAAADYAIANCELAYSLDADRDYDGMVSVKSDTRENLIRAAALLVAEIESLDRKNGRYTAHLHVRG